MADCGLTNLASCIPEKIAEFFLMIINAPLQPLLSLVKELLSEPVNISLFSSIWAIIVYIISIFYSLLFLYSGFNFIISGYDVERREKAKEWFKNIVIMIVLMNASYFLYEMIIDVGSLLSAGVLRMIDDRFFMLTADSLVSLGMQIIYTLPYIVILLITVLLLILRYIFVSIGVALFPIAIFLYFIPPARNYGKLIMKALLVNIFIPFIAGIILLAGSKFVELPLFLNFKSLIATASFLLVDVAILYLLQSMQENKERTSNVVKIAATAIKGF